MTLPSALGSFYFNGYILRLFAIRSARTRLFPNSFDSLVKDISRITGRPYEDITSDLHGDKGGIDDNNDIEWNDETGDFETPGGEPLS